MSKQVVVYPSGFIGYDVGWPVVRSEDNMDAQIALVRFSSSANKDRLTISNPIIEALFEQWRTRSRNTRQADFVSDICAAAANAFGTMSFYEWCYMQQNSPYFTSYHRQFLNETIAFATNGEERTIGYPTWTTLLKTTLATHEDAKERYKFQDYLIPYGVENLGMHFVIEQWLRKRNGIDDLLTTAHLIFGNAL